MKTVKSMAVIGACGMLGSDLVELLSDSFKITGISRDNYHLYKGKHFNVIVNANGNSKRYWANEHPLEDFVLSTESVYRSITDFNSDLYIYISSSDVYENHSDPRFTVERNPIDTNNLQPYGLHKYFSETLIRRYVKNYLILRSCLILGRNLKKGPFYDIKTHNPLFITRTSRLQIITTSEIAKIIDMLIRKKVKQEIFNMGGKGVFSFNDVKRYFSVNITFSKKAHEQIYEMNVSKLNKLFNLKSSESYLSDYLRNNS